MLLLVRLPEPLVLGLIDATVNWCAALARRSEPKLFRGRIASGL